MSISGECFCGSVAYEISGSLSDARSCHCSRCRKVFSGPASAYAVVNPDEFRWTRGEALLSTYVGAHGAGVQFCSKCGSTLCGVVGGKVHGVTLGCVNGDPGVEIGYHIFVGSRAPWDVIPPGVTSYDEGKPGP